MSTSLTFSLFSTLCEFLNIYYNNIILIHCGIIYFFFCKRMFFDRKPIVFFFVFKVIIDIRAPINFLVSVICKAMLTICFASIFIMLYIHL